MGVRAGDERVGVDRVLEAVAVPVEVEDGEVEAGGIVRAPGEAAVRVELGLQVRRAVRIAPDQRVLPGEEQGGTPDL